jgi:1,2-diacylglycerol 3-alpha-glucosyltransferase
MRVTVLFDNLGPYHLARLSAAASMCEVTALELNATSADYLWRADDSHTTFARRTVFSSRPQSEFDSGERLAVLNRALEETRPNVLAIPGWSGWHAFAAMEWALKKRVPVVVMSESTATDEPRTPWKESVKRRYLRLCSTALVGGERHAQYLTQLGMPPDEIFDGYDVVDTRYFGDASERVRSSAEDWRRQLMLPAKYFLASARFIEKKNLEMLLRAYAKYRGAIMDQGTSNDQVWDLTILGDGPLRASLVSLRARLGLAESVHLPGFRQYDELPAYYALASAFIHPSVVEPWGLVVNEAIACGLPVLVSDRCGCTPTLVRDGENGRIFDPYNVQAIASCLLETARSTANSRQAMGRMSQRIAAEFGTDRFATGLHAASAAALSSAAKAPRILDRLLIQALLWKSSRRGPRSAHMTQNQPAPHSSAVATQ